MLYKFNKQENCIELMPYYDFEALNKKEKDLENLLANNLSELYVEDGQLMTIFQERARQEEPDLCALDKEGNLVIFELKRGEVQGDTTIQVMRYSQVWGQMSYFEIETFYKKYCEKNKISFRELNEAHKDAFGLDAPIKIEQFNKKQKLIIVGRSSDEKLIEAVDYWKSKGLVIDFIPYRIYDINGNYYFEFFSKPYDIHINPKDRKGIIFDTNKTYDEDSIWDMLGKHKVSAYGSVASLVNSFNKGDFVFYYHKGYGIVAAGIVKSEIKNNPDYKRDNESYKDVELITPEIKREDEIRRISPSEVCELLNKGFYWAKTTKVPYLSEEESIKLVNCLKEKYNQK